MSPRSVLITGCSDGGMGAALALGLHKAGCKVIATARSAAKMEDLRSSGIETLELDVTSQESIAACLAQVSSLDILINNAGGQYTMPVTDSDLDEGRKLFDLNCWSQVSMVQAFLPLLRQSSHPMIVNHTSAAGFLTIPFQGLYSASKAAAAVISDVLRLELAPFGVKVVDLRTGMVQTNLIDNRKLRGGPSIPPNSIYEPARDILETSLSLEKFAGAGTTPEAWAEGVVRDLLGNPPSAIWRGDGIDFAEKTAPPVGINDEILRQSSGLDQVEEAIRKSRQD